MRRYIAFAAVLAACAISAPSALADSIVYEKGGNVWAANPDGSGRRQVTTSGGYSHPSQANDGTIAAVKGGLLQRLDRSGRVLNLAGDPEGSGPIVSSISPDGSLIAYHFNATGSIVSGLRTALSHADRQTSNDEIFNIGGWINPAWVGDRTILMFDGSESFTGDTLSTRWAPPARRRGTRIRCCRSPEGRSTRARPASRPPTGTSSACTS